MNRIGRNIILKAGLERKATSFILTGEVDDKTIAARLNSEGATELDGSKVLVRDVIEFKRYLEGKSKTALANTLAKDGTMKEMAGLIHERVSGIVDMAGRVEQVTGVLYDRVEEMLAEEDGDINTDLLDAAAKQTKLILDIVKIIKTDTAVQQIVKAGTVNLNQGMSQEECFEMVMKTGRELGHDKSAILSAYARAMQSDGYVDVSPE